jgi:leucyl-tRNA synthetase
METEGRTDLNAAANKWQKEWEKSGIFRASTDSNKKKYFVMEMFPYPSASFLHMGHVRNYTIGDVFARYKRMCGFNVLYPMGYDAFGLPAENAAKKSNIHPSDYAHDSIRKIMEYQKALGNSYDWDRTISTCEPEYYRWNQFFFIKMMEKGLAYRKKAPVNWCPKCESVLANEEAESGKCWRCETEVVKKELPQWFMKITAYADELLSGLSGLEWPDKIKTMQENWIGKSYGVEINFKIDKEDWPVFTTRIDTIFGATFMVMSAQHPKLLSLCTKEHKEEVSEFIKKCSRVSGAEEENLLEKEGVFTGKYAENPITTEMIPVYAGNFVVADYGCGMVMAVPAHDERDYSFAKKYKIPIKEVISGGDISKCAFTEYGTLVNSGEFSGLSSEDAKEKLALYAENKKIGKKVVNFKIRDWMISRQRYWGTPIPVIYCEKCGAVPVPEKDLPVLLPREVNFNAKENPLLSSREFVNVKCPKCGGAAKRETDTMGGFMDSSWYFLRYCSPHAKDVPFEKKSAEYWMPVDQYIGGAEHAVMHLIYARFFTKVLRDFGYFKFSEPFTRLFNQGIVYKDGHKMSKSFGNVVFQTDISEKYGIDTARLFLMFVASPDKQMEWSESGVEGSYRIIMRMASLAEKIKNESTQKDENKINITIKKFRQGIETFQYPKAIISIIEALDYFSKGISKKHYETLLKMFSLFCPHISEELWHNLGNESFISIQGFPECDDSKIEPALEELSKRIEILKDDIRRIIQIARQKDEKAEPAGVKLIVAPSWKYNAVLLAKTQMEATRNIGDIIKALLKEKEIAPYAKDIPNLVGKLLKNPQLIVQAELTQEDELLFLQDEKNSLSEEFSLNFEFEKAESSKEDKKEQALPGKPAIIIQMK